MLTNYFEQCQSAIHADTLFQSAQVLKVIDAMCTSQSTSAAHYISASISRLSGNLSIFKHLDGAPFPGLPEAQVRDKAGDVGRPAHGAEADGADASRGGARFGRGDVARTRHSRAQRLTMLTASSAKQSARACSSTEVGRWVVSWVAGWTPGGS